MGGSKCPISQMTTQVSQEVDGEPGPQVASSPGMEAWVGSRGSVMIGRGRIPGPGPAVGRAHQGADFGVPI